MCVRRLPHPVGAQIPATANYQTGATVGALPSEVDDINNAQTTADNAGSLAGSAQNAADNAQTTADNAGSLAGSAQNAADAAQDTADLIPEGGIIPDPQFTKSTSTYDTKYWRWLAAGNWHITTDAGSQTPVARIDADAVSCAASAAF